jgi:hypothetical protein
VNPFRKSCAALGRASLFAENAELPASDDLIMPKR